jgi:hypothetical protein
MNSYITEYNKKEYDYSQINVNDYVSYGDKHYKSLDELLKNVFVVTSHYPNGRFEQNPNNFIKFIKNEKICIYSWFVKRESGCNSYHKCEILITTYGRVLYNVSYEFGLFTSMINLKEYNFWLSNHNINILKLMLDSIGQIQDAGVDNQTDTHFGKFERLIKNINGVLENMRYMERHKKSIEFEYPDNDDDDYK